MSRPPSLPENHHNEQTRDSETVNPTASGAVEHALYRHDEKQEQSQSQEAIESIHDVSITSSNDEAEATSSMEDNDLRDVEASIAEPPYTVFTASQKRFIVFMASWAGFFSPVSSQIYFPALNTLAKDLHVSNSLINLTLTSYMVCSPKGTDICMEILYLGDLANSPNRSSRVYLRCSSETSPIRLADDLHI